MIRANALQNYVRAQPFRPFRIVMNSGKSYDVRHPEMVRVSKDICVYFHGDAPEAPFERFEMVSLMLMEHLEHLDQPAPAKPGNGQ